jgi:hypothetical protein
VDKKRLPEKSGDSVRIGITKDNYANAAITFRISTGKIKITSRIISVFRFYQYFNQQKPADFFPFILHYNI